MDKAEFLITCETIKKTNRAKNGIGTLSEKTLHAVLKKYFEPDESKHEIRVGSFVADIVNDNNIIEIQTGNFNKLRKKLELFLDDYSVTIVYPIAKTKWLLWLDPETGEMTNKRKSPRRGTPYDAFFELYKIKYLLPDPNLKLCIVLFDSEEYRYLNGWSQNKKRGSSRFERIPVSLEDEIMIENRFDYIKLIPEKLPEEFMSTDFKKASGLSLSGAQTALNVLYHLGAVERVGKKGNSHIYKRNV